VLHAPPISIFSILSPARCWARSTDHSAPHSTVYLYIKITKAVTMWKFVVFFLLGYSPVFEFYMRFGTLCQFHLHRRCKQEESRSFKSWKFVSINL
jgi:hypothetical protein